ncbi:helix-turn-helix domain-containing protein [Rhizobium leguminosarum]|uniref:helix-turn-helix domain-containing protein n=1 Tax=Rhizobium leguminosarum TaxID=384 RepID=UPI00103CB6C3|nr:helix-turn-helix domain-containing protein [Rhizobium leguminosarum]NKK29199.1 helix-turn-helix domain-containing protein [Rhizobium leguminosarum bv. viciae]TBZ46195.1 helix-turn-helix domain-containing protein [Rhizobium leguminosarum bv. viciae]
MSHDAVQWARKQRLGNPVAKNVLVALAEHHNGKTAQCNPKVATICLETDYSERAVRKALTKLKQAGLIRVEGGGKAGNSYQLSGDFNRHAVPDNETPELNLTGTSAGLTGTSCTPEPAPGAPPYKELESEHEGTGRESRKSAPTHEQGCRLPKHFEPDIAEALERGFTADEGRLEAEAFRNYWHSKAGADSRRVSWPATWRNWLIRELKWRQERRGNGHAQRPSKKPDFAAFLKGESERAHQQRGDGYGEAEPGFRSRIPPGNSR